MFSDIYFEQRQQSSGKVFDISKPSHLENMVIRKRPQIFIVNFG